MTAVMVEIGFRPDDANTPQEAEDGPWSSSPTWMFTSSMRCARATPATITRTDPWCR